MTLVRSKWKLSVVLVLISFSNVKMETTAEADELAKRDVDKYLKSKFMTFARRGFEQHNRFRSLHHSPPLKWSDRLAVEAQKLAYNMAIKGTIKLPELAQFGENRAKLSAVSYSCELAGEEATKIWYNQGTNYSFADPRLNSKTDSFTQLVWRDSREVGMGCAQRKGTLTNEIYVVALYYPSGNNLKGLRKNVLGSKTNLNDVYASLFRKDVLFRIKGKTPSVST